MSHNSHPFLIGIHQEPIIRFCPITSLLDGQNLQFDSVKSI